MANIAVDLRDVQVIKDGRTFLLSDRFGDVPEENSAALGLYHRDTRFLCRLELMLNEAKPILLHSSTESNFSQLVELAYPVQAVDPTGLERRGNLSLQRQRVLGTTLHERIRVRNFGSDAREVRLALAFAADFLDIFEVRGFVRERRGQEQPPEVERSRVTLRYRGLDGDVRSTILRFSPAPEELSEERASFRFELPAGAEQEIVLEITPDISSSPTERRSMGETTDRLSREYSGWKKRCARFRTTNPQLQGFLDRAIMDIRMLTSHDDDGVPYLDAGVPWFSTLFGRDSLITAYQALAVDPELAWGTLRGLAEHQGKQRDTWREEEPGKILHELRDGELARTGEIPHTPYFGTVDATPLWIVLLAYAYWWTGDAGRVKEVWPHALAALRWIDEYGDSDGDGYVEYQKLSEHGLDNQGWKDSHDAIVHPDGTHAEGAIALAEVQGYVYAAKAELARVANDMGEVELGLKLAREAGELRQRFNRDFWLEREGYFALALDGNKEPVRTISSNPGHCLWSGIVDEELAPRLARRLVSPALSSGWGIRTLGTRQGAFDPIGYHTGSVWPHDTALIAHGLKRYGFDSEARKVLDQLALAGAYFPYSRFPELFCGFSREEVPVPVQYPVACRPQAWASGTPLLMVRSYAGFKADAPNKRLFIQRPQLPRWIDRVDVLGMRVGEARLDLSFTNQDGVTAVQVPRKEGDLEVLIRQ